MRGSVYHSPCVERDKEEYLQLFGIDRDYIYAGDFNAKHKSWNCSKTNTRGRTIKSVTDEVDAMILAPDESTFMSYNSLGTGILDI